MRHRHAFSLVELCLVMATIGVVAAMAVPRYVSSIERYRAESAARRLAADLTLAQSRARVLSSAQTLVFTGNTYQITGMTDPEHPSSTYTVDLSADPYFAAVTSVLCGPTSGAYTQSQITFNGYGAPYTTDASGAVNASAARFVVSAGGVQKMVRVDVDSGAVTIQ